MVRFNLVDTVRSLVSRRMMHGQRRPPGELHVGWFHVWMFIMLIPSRFRKSRQNDDDYRVDALVEYEDIDSLMLKRNRLTAI